MKLYNLWCLITDDLHKALSTEEVCVNYVQGILEIPRSTEASISKTQGKIRRPRPW